MRTGRTSVALCAALAAGWIGGLASAPAWACDRAAAPTPLSPYGSLPPTAPLLQWTAVPGATGYTVLVQQGDDAGAVIASVTDHPTTSWTPPTALPTDRRLRWKVKAQGPCDGWYSLNLYFTLRTAASPTVAITSPIQSSTVSGTVAVAAAATDDVVKVEFSVDGVLQATDLAAPFEFSWDSRINPLRRLGRIVEVGYSAVEWQTPSTFELHRAEVDGSTDTYDATLANFATLPQSQWIPTLAESLRRAAAEYKRICLRLDLDRPEFAGHWTSVLAAAAPVWSSVSRIEVAGDASGWSVSRMATTLDEVENWLVAQSLPVPRGLPGDGLGATTSFTQPVPAWKTLPRLDWIGLQAFLVPPGGALSGENIEQLRAQLAAARLQAPADKYLLLEVMANDSSQAGPPVWTDPVRLRDLQSTAFVVASEDPRVRAIRWVSYAPPGATRDNPQWKTPHRLVGDSAGRQFAVPGAGNGPRTLMAKATTADGRTIVQRLGVYVVNPYYADTGPFTPQTPQIERVTDAGIANVWGVDSLGLAYFGNGLPIQRYWVAWWLLRAKHGRLYRPPAATGQFTDLFTIQPPWAEEAVRRGLVVPCAVDLYCPEGNWSRRELAIGFLRLLEGPSYQPPPCQEPRFTDVPCGAKASAWINELGRRGLAPACAAGPTHFCPAQPVRREELAALIDQAFGPLP